MSGPMNAPWTDVGRLQSDISNIESQLRGKADSHEVHSLHSKLGSVEHTNQELRSDLDELRRQCDSLRENFREALNVLSQMTTVL